jgi:hypothetical protein
VLRLPEDMVDLSMPRKRTKVERVPLAA